MYSPTSETSEILDSTVAAAKKNLGTAALFAAALFVLVGWLTKRAGR